MLKLTRNVAGTNVPPALMPMAVTAGFPTPEIKEDWERLSIEAIGPWSSTLHPASHWIPQPAIVQYPQKPRLNTVYWPTHVGGFAFCWTVLSESQLELLDAEGPGPQAVTDVWVDWRDDNPRDTLPAWPFTTPVARMWLLRAKAVWVQATAENATLDRGLWVVPLVDYRYFLNQTSFPEVLPTALGANTALIDYINATIGAIALDFSFVPGQDYPVGKIPKIEPGSLLDLDGPLGSVADGLLAMIGRRACFIPEGYAIGYPDGPSVAMHPTDSATNFDARVDGWIARKRVGGRPRFWSARDLPVGFRFNYLTSLVSGGRSFFELASSALISLVEGGVTSPGGISPGPKLDFHLSWLQVTSSGQLADLTAVATNLATRALQWLTRPIDVVVAGMEPAIQTAHVGMWEWRTDEGETAIHGLDPASAWYGSLWVKPPELSTGSGCVPCGWLRDRQALIDGNRVLKIYITGNNTPLGRCGCIPTQGYPPTDTTHIPWIAVYDPGPDLWILWATPESCCSCGSMALNITGQPIDPVSGDLFPTFTAQLIVNHACGGGGGPGSTYTFDMVYECCDGDSATFTGYGPELCNEVMPEGGWPCDNTFKMVVSCGACELPTNDCDVCREVCAPPYYRISTSAFSGAYSDYNGDWYLQPDPVVPCLWSVECVDILITLTLSYTGTIAHATLVFSGGAGGTLTYTETPGPGTWSFICFGGLGVVLSGSHSGAAFSLSLIATYCKVCKFCCDGKAPVNIIGTVSNLTGGCALCFPFTVVPMALQATPDPSWLSDFFNNPCHGQSGLSDYVNLSCGKAETGEWSLSSTCGDTVYTFVSARCDPFEVIIDATYTAGGPAASKCCDGSGGTARWTFTEAP